MRIRKNPRTAKRFRDFLKILHQIQMQLITAPAPSTDAMAAATAAITLNTIFQFITHFFTSHFLRFHRLLRLLLSLLSLLTL